MRRLDTDACMPTKLSLQYVDHNFATWKVLAYPDLLSKETLKSFASTTEAPNKTADKWRLTREV